MGDALAVRVFQRIQDVTHDAPDLFQGKAFIGLKIIPQFTALDKLHGDEGDALALRRLPAGARHHRIVVFSLHFAIVVHGDDARMVQPSGGLRFAFEARQHVSDLGAVELRWQNGLDGNGALNHRIKALVHHAHCAFAKLAPDQVFTKFGQGRHGFSRIANGLWTGLTGW